MTLDAFRTEALSSINAAGDPQALEAVRVALLGKKGQLTERLKSLGSASPEERKTLGAALNVLKDELTAAIDARETVLARDALNARLATETIDVTLPVRPRVEGRLHPISQTLDEMVSIFARMGFSVEEGPEIEDDEHNFTALNFPEFHPARQMHDTFFLNAQAATGTPYLLRTHTSPIQIRTMRRGKPPFRFIAHGATYRCDSDQTHTPMFHQLECLVIEPGIHMGHLKGCIADFLKAFFEIPEVPLRFRPSFFPFTEPSAEVDIGCKRGKDTLEIGTGDDWLEVLGCGMVHPNVLKNCGLDPEIWQGFAFGMGVERLAMLKYGIPDLRTFFESDARWLAHYGFDPLEPLGLKG